MYTEGSEEDMNNNSKRNCSLDYRKDNNRYLSPFLEQKAATILSPKTGTKIERIKAGCDH